MTVEFFNVKSNGSPVTLNQYFYAPKLKSFDKSTVSKAKGIDCCHLPYRLHSLYKFSIDSILVTDFLQRTLSCKKNEFCFYPKHLSAFKVFLFQLVYIMMCINC